MKKILLLLMLSLYIHADELPNPEFILNEALTSTPKTTFQSTTPIYKNGKVERILQLHHQFLAGVVSEKAELLWNNGQKDVCISNQNGTYFIIANTQFFYTTRHVFNRYNIYTSIGSLKSQEASYSIAAGLYQENPCYIVTGKIQDDEEAINRYVAKLGTRSNAQEFVTSKMAFSRTYTIDKKTSFVYSCTFFNKNGNKIFAADWGNVDMQKLIPLGTFSLPPNDFINIDKDSDKLEYCMRLFNVPDRDKNETEKSNTINQSEAAREILINAMNVTEKASFKSVCTVLKGGKIEKTLKSYRQVLPDGTIREREEILWANSWKELYIPTHERTFLQINNTWVKADFKAGSREFMYKAVRSDAAETTTYSMDEITYKNIPCYKINVKIPSDDDYVTERVKRMTRTKNKPALVLMEKLPFARTFIVGKKNFFIYSVSFYNIQGRRTLSEEWGDVEFNPSFDNSLFEPPKGVSFESAKTPKDLERIKARCTEQFKK